MTDADEQSSMASSGNLMAYRINRQVGVEFVPADGMSGQQQDNSMVQPVLFGADGLQSISLTNFTGHLIFRRAPEPDDSIIFSDTASVSNLGSVAPTPSSEHGDGDHTNPPSNFLDEDTTEGHEDRRNAEKVAAGAAGGAVLGLAARAFVSGNSAAATNTATASAPPTPSTISAVSPTAKDGGASGAAKAAASGGGGGGGAAFGLAAAALMEQSKAGESPETAPDTATTDDKKETASAAKLSGKRKLTSATGLLRKILNVTSVKRSIPESVRRLRSQTRDSMKFVSPTPLHDLCERPNVTLEQLFDCLNAHPNSLKTKDSNGRYPLHIIADNDDLITSEAGRDVATVFSGHLINEFPNACLHPDNDGFLPFGRILADWIDWANNQEKLKKEYEESSHHDETDISDHDKHTRVRTNATYYSGHQANVFSKTARSLTNNAMTRHWLIGTAKRKFFPRVEIWEEVEWCLSMLSTEMDILARNQNVPMFQRLREKENNINTDDRTIMVEGIVARLPLLLHTILLIDDDGIDTRQRILDMAVCRRMVLCPSSVGTWVTELLNHGGVPAKRAVDYLVLVSNASIEDYMGGFGTAHTSDWDAFNEDRIEVYEKIGNLKGTIASLVTLPVSETERAASTSAIWHTMSNKLSRHFVLGLVLIDLILHFTMMVSFRSLAIANASINRVDVDAHGVVYFISAHYFLRKGCEAWVLMSISFATFRGYFSNLWTIFDTLAIIMTLMATIVSDASNEYATGLNTLVVGLLWIKVLGFLKVVNKQMSTFILALTQILYDIRFFMIVLLVCVLMFGDMFYIAVSSKDNGDFCDDDEPESGAIQDFCSSPWSSYLRTYVILLGDFELDDMTETAGTTVLFIIFTIVGVVILLNVLIAVISDSYERATMSSTLLFGRARVLYVAQNEALEEFLRPQVRETTPETEHYSTNRYFRKSLRWTVLVAIIGTAIYAQLFLIGAIIGFSEQGSIVAAVLAGIMAGILFCALWVVITFILDGILRDLLPDRAENVYDFMNKINNCLVGAMSNWLFGLSREKVQSLSTDEDEDEEEWSGRMKYLENVIDRIVSETKVELKSEMMEMRAEMHEHFDDDH